MNADDSASNATSATVFGIGLNRRRLLQGALASAVSLPLLERMAWADSPTPAAPVPDTMPTLKATLGEGIIYTDLVGDTWDPTWADDGDLYTPRRRYSRNQGDADLQQSRPL